MCVCSYAYVRAYMSLYVCVCVQVRVHVCARVYCYIFVCSMCVGILPGSQLVIAAHAHTHTPTHTPTLTHTHTTHASMLPGRQFIVARAPVAFGEAEIDVAQRDS
jgi:hypothetical protein